MMKLMKSHVLHSLLAGIFILHISLSANAQAAPDQQGEIKVTVIGRNITLLSAFKRIEKQTGLRFNYRPEQLNTAERITLAYKERTLNEVLGALLTTKGFIWKYIDNSISLQLNNRESGKGISLPLESTVKDTTVTGTITDKSGKAMAGVSIGVIGGRIGTTTNSKGMFTLNNVPLNSVLVVSSVGYETQQVKLNGDYDIRVELDIVVQEIQPVEVVSTGYQDIPKERATGSFVKIDNATLNQQVGTNILNRLDGVTSGLLFNIGKSNRNPQNNTNITIRGLSTINGPLDPLVVLDGFIYEGDINNINPNDIEDVTVLKDAAAASIWGARAGNGVIIINTKKGRISQKLQVAVNANIILKEKPDLYNLPQMSSADYIDVEQFLFNKGYFDNQINTQPFSALTPAVEVFLKRRSGLITATDSANHINYFKAIDTRNEYNKYVYTQPVTQQYSVNLRGGGSNNAYVFSLAYDKNIGELRNQHRKVNIRVQNTYKPVKNLQLDLGVYYTNSETQSGMPAYNSIRPGGRAVPYFQLADDSGKPLSVQRNYRNDYVDTAGAGKLLDWKYYLLEEYKNNRSVINLQELFANVGVQYKLLKFLNIDFKYQYQKQQSVNEQIADTSSYMARDIINTYSQLNRSTGIVKYIVPLGSVRTLGNSTVESHTIRGQLSLNHNINNHSISAILGGETREAKGYSDQYTVYGYSADPLTYSNTDFVNTYPNFLTGNYSSIPGSPSFTNTVFRFVSVYGNAAYTFKGRYTVSGSVRKDGSNIFGVNTNDKWKPLWSVGSAWKISDESFYKSDFLPVLKARITYGYSGNVDLSRSALPIARYFNTNSRTTFPFARVTTINNPELRWEQSEQLNIGVDFSFIKEIISGSIEYYIKKGTDLYGETPYDYTTFGAVAEITKNVANMRGHGVDIAIHSNNIRRGLKWNTDFLLNYNSNKTTQYFKTTALNTSTLIGGGNTIIPVVGKPLYGIAAYKWGGLDSEGNPQGFLNGQLSTDYSAIANEAATKGLDSGNIVFIGPGTPALWGGVINTLAWKQLSLSFNLSYKFSYFFIKPTIRYSGLITQGGGHKDYENRWQKPGDELITNVPSFIYPNVSMRDDFYSSSEINVLNGGNIRLQYVNLSYSLDKNSLRSNIFRNLQLYINVANIGILWRANNKGLDPDYPGSIQPPKLWAFGIRGSF